jgi:hypothetical protein
MEAGADAFVEAAIACVSDDVVANCEAVAGALLVAPFVTALAPVDASACVVKTTSNASPPHATAKAFKVVMHRTSRERRGAASSASTASGSAERPSDASRSMRTAITTP